MPTVMLYWNHIVTILWLMSDSSWAHLNFNLYEVWGNLILNNTLHSVIQSGFACQNLIFLNYYVTNFKL